MRTILIWCVNAPYNHFNVRCERMDIASTEQYKGPLIRLIERVSSEPVELIFVDDVSSWCSERDGENKGNPAAKAIRDRKTRKAGILLRRSIDSDRVNQIKGRMNAGGYWVESSALDSPDKLLAHLVLHELAHLLNNWGQEEEEQCDGWAFEKMGI